ncbi:MAG: FkbM family methyltransferase [Opitutaceae bacterium]
MLLNVVVSDRVGTATFHVNSHAGTHYGAQRYWDGFAEAVTTVDVPTTTLDCFVPSGMDRLDILKMDIQGGELAALKGAAGLLSRQRSGRWRWRCCSSRSTRTSRRSGT